jgi:two-component system, chemotaxis family, response regulator Rcp1
MKIRSTLNIVIADDDASDRELIIDAIMDASPHCNTYEMGNGQELIEFLDGCKKYPDLIFLDLNMPIKSGKETLAYLKKTERLKVIPVFVLSTSSAQGDIFDCYHQGANLFLVKPSSYEVLVTMMRNIISLFEINLVKAEIV